MSDPYIGEIRLITYVNFIPEGWLACDGRKYSIAQYQALAAVIGNLYGGDLKTYFNVPDLCGRSVAGVGLSPTGGAVTRAIASKYGDQTVALTFNNMPTHSHIMQLKRNALQYAGKTAGPSATSNPAGLLSSTGKKYSIYQTGVTPSMILNANVLGPSNGGTATQSHENMQPYQLFVYAIAWNGVFPVHP